MDKEKQILISKELYSLLNNISHIFRYNILEESVDEYKCFFETMNYNIKDCLKIIKGEK